MVSRAGERIFQLRKDGRWNLALSALLWHPVRQRNITYIFNFLKWYLSCAFIHALLVKWQNFLVAQGFKNCFILTLFSTCSRSWRYNFFFPFGLFRLEKTFKIIEFCVFFCFGFFPLSSLSAVVGRITEIGPKMCTTAVKLQDHWLVGCPTLAASEIR